MDTNDQNQMLTLAKLSWYFNSLNVLGEEGAKLGADRVFPDSVQTSRPNEVDQRDLCTVDVLTNTKLSSVCFVIKCQLVWPPIPTNSMGNQEKESKQAETLQISTCPTLVNELWHFCANAQELRSLAQLEPTDIPEYRR